MQGYPHIFALGDVNDVAENKMGYLAGEQAKLTADNLKALAKGGSPTLKVRRCFVVVLLFFFGGGAPGCVCAGRASQQWLQVHASIAVVAATCTEWYRGMRAHAAT